MKRIEKFDQIPANTDIIAGIDLIGNIKQLFSLPLQAPGFIFLLCTRGTCTLTIHLTQYQLKENSLAIVAPNMFLQIKEQSSDCRFIFVAYSKELIYGSTLFSHTIEYTPYIFEHPVVDLSKKVGKLFHDYFMMLIRILDLNKEETPQQQIRLSYTQIIMFLSIVIKESKKITQVRYNSKQEIAKELVRMVVQYYKTERNISFYAEKMHLSPQHLSTTIKKITGKTLTDIISSFIIHDAQAKLRSTEMTIQEIAYSLNFPDISFFGKYFKRYTGMSPKQYRNS